MFAPSSPPTEGRGTLSYINPTQCIGERSITPSDFEGSADEDDDLELLVERIKSWSPVSGIMATIHGCTDCEEAKLLLPSRW